jgi:ABC-2 type transport system permease protein
MSSRQQLTRAWYVTQKDIRTYYLKPPAISWGMLFPLVMILSFYLRDPGGIRTAAPGLIGMTMLFGATSIEAVVIAFEKRIGAMERLLMAPITPAALLLAKAAGGAIFASGTGIIVWLISSVVWRLPLRSGPGVLLAVLLGSVTFALLGVLVSLLMREVFDAMTLSNYFRFPMIFLCGVFLPIHAMPPALRIIGSLLPLTYTVDALRHLLLQGTDAFYPLWLDLGVSLVYAVVLYAVALALMRRRLEDLL